MNTFTSVVFLNTFSEYDVERFNKILKPSINYLENKILVIPEKRNDVNTDGFQVILDEEIIDVMHGKPSYQKQGLLKLYVSKIIQTTHYLILDSDIYVNKKFSYNDFFTDDKICLFVFDADGYIKKQNKECCHSKWLHESFRFLEKRKKKLTLPFLYGVTPGLFVTKHVRDLINVIEEKENKFKEKYLYENFGCEYSLYYTHVNDKNLYTQDLNKKLIQGLWYDDHKLDTLDSEYVFWVIQSTIKHDVNDLVKFIAEKSLSKNLT